jgi:hypothetical protein
VTQQEKELVWLAKKVKRDEDLIDRLETHLDDNHHKWSKEVIAAFLDGLLKKKDQMWYEMHRLEKLAWQVVEYREKRGEVPPRDALFVFNEVTQR